MSVWYLKHSLISEIVISGLPSPPPSNIYSYLIRAYSYLTTLFYVNVWAHPVIPCYPIVIPQVTSTSDYDVREKISCMRVLVLQSVVVVGTK